MYAPCELVVTTTSVPRSTSFTLTLASGITAPAESRTTPAIPPLSFWPTAFGANAVAATRTARTNGNRYRPLLFIVHSLLITPKPACVSFLFLCWAFVFALDRQRSPIVCPFVNHFVCI